MKQYFVEIPHLHGRVALEPQAPSTPRKVDLGGLKPVDPEPVRRKVLKLLATTGVRIDSGNLPCIVFTAPKDFVPHLQAQLDELELGVAIRENDTVRPMEHGIFGAIAGGACG